MKKKTRFSKFVWFIAGIVTGILVNSIHLRFGNRKSGIQLDNPKISLKDKEIKDLLEIDSKISEELGEKVRVFCYVLTGKQYHQTRAVHIKATWAKRCDKVVFYSSEDDPSLPAVNLDVSEGRGFLWEKTKKSFQHVYDNYLDDYDWFLKTDDDTYIVMENLRLLLLPHSPADPIYFGCKFKVKNAIYHSGGAGYVLSREAVKRFVEQALPDKTKCSIMQSEGAEDLEMGRCLSNVGVIAGDSRDFLERHRFFPLSAEHVVQHIFPNWLGRYSVYDMVNQTTVLSEFTISFHYVTPANLYTYEYLVYRLKPFGINKALKLAKNQTLSNSILQFARLISGPDHIVKN